MARNDPVVEILHGKGKILHLGRHILGLAIPQIILHQFGHLLRVHILSGPGDSAGGGGIGSRSGFSSASRCKASRCDSGRALAVSLFSTGPSGSAEVAATVAD